MSAMSRDALRHRLSVAAAACIAVSVSACGSNDAVGAKDDNKGFESPEAAVRGVLERFGTGEDCESMRDGLYQGIKERADSVDAYVAKCESDEEFELTSLSEPTNVTDDPNLPDDITTLVSFEGEAQVDFEADTFTILVAEVDERWFVVPGP